MVMFSVTFNFAFADLNFRAQLNRIPISQKGSFFNTGLGDDLTANSGSLISSSLFSRCSLPTSYLEGCHKLAKISLLFDNLFQCE